MYEPVRRLLAGAVITLVAAAVAAAPASAQPRIKRFPLPTQDGRPLGLTVGPDGNVWFVENLGNKVGRITRSGHVRSNALLERWSQLATGNTVRTPSRFAAAR